MTEYVAEWAAAGPAAVDRTRGVVAGVKLLNTRSRNGRKYPPAVLARRHALYSGAAVNTGHHLDAHGRPTTVPPEHRFGRVQNVRPAADGGLVGDLHYNPKHAFAEPFLWACEHDPGQYGFSPLHRVAWANGGRPDADGDLVAEDVLRVLSVDIVSDGGTTSSVFESARPGTPPPSRDRLTELRLAGDLGRLAGGHLIGLHRQDRLARFEAETAALAAAGSIDAVADALLARVDGDADPLAEFIAEGRTPKPARYHPARLTAATAAARAGTPGKPPARPKSGPSLDQVIACMVAGTPARK